MAGGGGVGEEEVPLGMVQALSSPSSPFNSLLSQA